MDNRCPYCGAAVICVNSILIYKNRSYGYAWVCYNYPKCDAYVGCHPSSKKPLGTLANARLRKVRGYGHAAFDRLWKQKLFPSRLSAYQWLARCLNLDVEDTHFAMFDEATVLKAIDFCDDFYATFGKQKKLL